MLSSVEKDFFEWIGYSYDLIISVHSTYLYDKLLDTAAENPQISDIIFLKLRRFKVKLNNKTFIRLNVDQDIKEFLDSNNLNKPGTEKMNIKDVDIILKATETPDTVTVYLNTEDTLLKRIKDK